MMSMNMMMMTMSMMMGMMMIMIMMSIMISTRMMRIMTYGCLLDTSLTNLQSKQQLPQKLITVTMVEKLCDDDDISNRDDDHDTDDDDNDNHDGEDDNNISTDFM